METSYSLRLLMLLRPVTANVYPCVPRRSWIRQPRSLSHSRAMALILRSESRQSAIERRSSFASTGNDAGISNDEV